MYTSHTRNPHHTGPINTSPDIPQLGGGYVPRSSSHQRPPEQSTPSATRNANIGIPPPGSLSDMPFANPIYILPNDTSPSETLLREILEVARDNRSFQMASVQQQNMLISHLDRLNQWAINDRQNRQVELRDVSARIGHLRDDLNRVYQGQSQQPQAVIPPSRLMRFPPPRMGGQQISVPGGIPGYPPGSVPQHGLPVQPATTPTGSSETENGSSSELEYTPIIPPRPAGW